MMLPTSLLLAALGSATPPDPREVSVIPFVRQAFALHLANESMAGGAGAGLGAQAIFRERYIAEAEVGALWLLGNSVSTRLAIGAQRRGTWSPAGFVTGTVLFGDRLEVLAEDGSRAPMPNWALGVRAAPLRFIGKLGLASVLEPGVATDFRGSVYLEVTLIQAGASW
jgi:hypothetical protein